MLFPVHFPQLPASWSGGGRLQGALSSGSGGGGGGGRGAGLAAKLWSFLQWISGKMGPDGTTSQATPRIPPLTHLS